MFTGGVGAQANILISSERRACLADFGLAAVTEGPGSHRTGGVVRWTAPEILDPDRYGYVRRARIRLPSKSTDMYALGMTIFEVRTNLPVLPLPSRNLALPRRLSRAVNPSGVPSLRP